MVMSDRGRGGVSKGGFKIGFYIDGLDPLQLALGGVFYYHRLVQTLHLHSWWSSPATGTGGGSSMPTSPFTDVHKHICIDGHCNLHCVVVLVCCTQYTYTYVPSLHRKCCYNITLNHYNIALNH